eukprot:g11157.t1
MTSPPEDSDTGSGEDTNTGSSGEDSSTSSGEDTNTGSSGEDSSTGSGEDTNTGSAGDSSNGSGKKLNATKTWMLVVGTVAGRLILAVP